MSTTPTVTPTTCECCSQPCLLVSNPEGTSHYEPLPPAPADPAEGLDLEAFAARLGWPTAVDEAKIEDSLCFGWLDGIARHVPALLAAYRAEQARRAEAERENTQLRAAAGKAEDLLSRLPVDSRGRREYEAAVLSELRAALAAEPDREGSV